MSFIFEASRIAQSMLAPAGPHAARIESLWWLFFWISVAVFIGVVGFLGWALIRRGHLRVYPPAQVEDTEEHMRQLHIGVGAATVVAAILLFVLLIGSILTGESVGSMTGTGPTIEVTGLQWWWQVRYQDPTPANEVITANEIHIPVGQPVLLRLVARDVIHSLWIPELNGKTDLIPGQENRMWIQADHPGVFRGQCAEFCGLQHAHMGLIVVAEPPDQYNAWLAQQRKPAPEPTTDLTRHGREIFLSGPCPLCHQIQGTPAAGQVAPNLTHLASRQTIAAATAPNTPGHLGGWITDPQDLKPGNNMPSMSLSGGDLQALLAYLETLK